LVRFTELDTSSLIPACDQILELQGISVLINNSTIRVFNVYIPPTSANTRYSPDLSRILENYGDAFILGDFNAHHEAWHSSLGDTRGDTLLEQFENSNFFISNTDSPTRLPSNGDSSSPDISLISTHLALSVSWATDISLNSDHLPICISVIDVQPPS
jgi:endonuclease/exonuclease/phosphatase family metal-dependent hydrolase